MNRALEKLTMLVGCMDDVATDLEQVWPADPREVLMLEERYASALKQWQRIERQMGMRTSKSAINEAFDEIAIRFHETDPLPGMKAEGKRQEAEGGEA
jgi:hypothetical protein